jgi:glycosyltransferase involved in cell wall biosynthesis
MNNFCYPRLAVITMVYNEDVLLPQFLRHYSPQVDAVFLLDNESDDGSIAAAADYPNVEVSTVRTNGQLNDGIQMAAKMDVKEACVGKYDYVLLVDADEFVVPKSSGTLREAFSALREKEVFGTHGFNMFRGALEGVYDPAVPLLHQRQWGTESAEEYSKPIIVRPGSPATFSTGFHRLNDRDNDSLKPPSPTHFFLLHYTGIDEDLFVRRCLSRTRR